MWDSGLLKGERHSRLHRSGTAVWSQPVWLPGQGPGWAKRTEVRKEGLAEFLNKSSNEQSVPVPWVAAPTWAVVSAWQLCPPAEMEAFPHPG